MKFAVNHLRPVIWAKGTLLTPQHLQAQDRYLEDSLAFRLEALRFMPWGFSELEINPELLEAGTFSVTAASGIFPDGMPFSIPASDAPPPARNLTNAFAEDTKELDVYLAIPPYLAAGVNVAAGEARTDARYSTEVMVLRDENTGLTERPIQIARKNFRLLAAGVGLEGTASMRIGRVIRDNDGRCRLDRTEPPPMLDISVSSHIMDMLKRLVETMVARSATLSAQRRHRNQGLADFTSTDIANFWLLYTVNTFFPLLRHTLEARSGHPEELFRVLTELAGALTTFSTKIQPSELPTYEHAAPGPCFTKLVEQLMVLLETVAPSNCVSIPFQPMQNNILGAAITEDRYLSGTRLYLAVGSQSPEGEVISRVPRLVKLCSATHIDHLVRQALPGVVLTHEPNPPAFLPIKTGFQYFSLNQSGGPWEAIRRAHNIAAYVPGDIVDPKIELLVVLPQAE